LWLILNGLMLSAFLRMHIIYFKPQRKPNRNRARELELIVKL